MDHVNSNLTSSVLVYGAAGHTGRFVVDELLRRGITPVIAGRDQARLRSTAWPALEQRTFTLDSHDRIEAAVADVDVSMTRRSRSSEARSCSRYVRCS